MRKVCSLGISIATIALGSIACAQQITVVPLSTPAASSNYAVSPQADGVTFVGDAENENDFLIVIDGDVSKASILTMSPEGALFWYVDKDFVCVECGTEETWTAAQKKWYYEAAKGTLYAKAKRCHDCRMKIRKAKALQPVLVNLLPR